MKKMQRFNRKCITKKVFQSSHFSVEGGDANLMPHFIWPVFCLLMPAKINVLYMYISEIMLHCRLVIMYVELHLILSHI